MADKALLMGINQYKSISSLRGCENDVRNMARLLTETFDFQESNVRQHLSKEVTRKTFLDGFDWLVDGAQAGDRLVLHFAGHGSNIKRDSGDEPIDELICLYDMDIDNPETYLVDDDLGQLLERIPAGVRMSVVLDTCHSGTGTRRLPASRDTAAVRSPLMIIKATSRRIQNGDSRSLERQLAGSRSEVLDTLDEQNMVLARLYEHNNRMQAQRSRSPIRRFGQSLARERSTELNHQLLAAASATQTAADAFIDDDYFGAFTYHFCNAARNSTPGATLAEVMNAASSAIISAGFSQTPQNEGPGPDEPPFGPVTISPTIPVATPSSNGHNPQNSTVNGLLTQAGRLTPGLSTETASGVELVGQMLRVAEKFIDLADYLVRQTPDRAGSTPTISRVGTQVVVYVHGISQHREGYSLPWWNALHPHLSGSLSRQEVLWSPVVNPRSGRSAPRAQSQAEQDFVKQLDLVLEDRQQQLQTVAAPAGRAATPRSADAVRGADLSFDDFARYMFNKDEREEVLGIFDDVVRPLLKEGATVHIISHSWGTVVAWEGLQRLSSASLTGRVANLFVVGSALSLGPVKSNLRDRFSNLGRPTLVDRFYNLDARGDIVGGSVDPKFGVDQEFLELDTQGCSFFNISCAHSSYFKANNLRVNRDIFAKLING